MTLEEPLEEQIGAGSSSLSEEVAQGGHSVDALPWSWELFQSEGGKGQDRVPGSHQGTPGCQPQATLGDAPKLRRKRGCSRRPWDEWEGAPRTP